MKISKMTRFCCMLVILAGLFLVGKAFAADEAATLDTGRERAISAGQSEALAAGIGPAAQKAGSTKGGTP